MDAPGWALGGGRAVTEMSTKEFAEAKERNNPVIAHCPNCEHEWHVCYLPMPLEKAAKLMMAARCPKGCTAAPRVGSMANG